MTTRWTADCPLGVTVVCPPERWQHVLDGHPEMAGREADAQQAIADPDEIRLSPRAAGVQVASRFDGRWHVCVVYRQDTGLLLAAYAARRLPSQRTVVWTKSA